MIPELLSTIVGALVLAWSAFAALRATWSTTRLGMLSGLTTALLLILFIRLIGDFGGWGDWLLTVWLASMLAIVLAVGRAVLIWPELPGRGEDAKAHRHEQSQLGLSTALVLLVTAALLVPGLLL